MIRTNELKFWGVRGSIASPGPATAGVGGNTSCVEVQLGGQTIVIDGGTGLQARGRATSGTPFEGTLLFGHLHWDHIQGVPFFAPLYDARSRVRLMGPRALGEVLRQQMSGPMFPVTMDIFGASVQIEELEAGHCRQLGPVRLSTAPLNHPGGGLAYRLEADGVSVVYAVDTEHPDEGVDRELCALARGATVLIYDAQYLPEEYSARRGWGHSTYEQGAALAQAAGVGSLVLTHHDPARDDMAVMRLEQRARRLFAQTWVAREGMRLELAPPLPREQSQPARAADGASG